MRVVCPADEAELVDALPAILDEPGPCYVRYNARPPAVDHAAPYALGSAEVLSRGEGVGILTYGLLVREAVEARAILEERGVPVRLVNLRSLAPVDEAAILEAARKTWLLVTLEDHFLSGGLHTLVAELMLRHRVSPRPLAIALEARWFKPALLPDVLRHEGFTGAAIAQRILDAL